MSRQPHKTPTLRDALTPLLALIVLLVLSVYLFGEDSSYGANQIALILCAGIAGLIGIKNGLSWSDIQTGITTSITVSMTAILILLAVGMLIGTWIIAGTVPAMVSFGLALLSPQIFYPAACLICAVIALSIGSSWTVAGTVGIGLIGVAQSMELSVEITAGAIISGAYLGDKLSPLSDTTNLAASVANVDLFSHIRNLMWSTIPSFLLALILFTFFALGEEVTVSESELAQLQSVLSSQFSVAWYMLLPVAVVVVLSYKRWPAFPTVLVGALSGIVIALLFQFDKAVAFGGFPENAALSAIKGLWMVSFDGYQSNTGNEILDELLSKGGMSSMLNTVWLILSAMMFGGAMEKAGLLDKLLRQLLSSVHSAGGLIRTLIVTCIGSNMVTADQYISIIVPGRMFQNEFKRRRLHGLNLSRNIEDSATLSSVLVPWNTCGAFMAATLGVATQAYFFFAFFNLINPLLAVIYSYTHFKIIDADPEIESQETL